MGIYTRFTRRWLDERYRQTDDDGVHRAHQPLFGRGAQGESLRNHVYALARQTQILEALSRFRAATLLDVGASEGLCCHLARELFGVAAVGCDLSAESCKRAVELLGVDQVACDSARLPFADRSFDAVICSEVLEHVEFPVETLLELERVARRVLIITTDEVRLDRRKVERHRAPFLPHTERNLFHPDDFRAILGPGVSFASQPRGAPPDEPRSDEEVARWIVESLADPRLEANVGALILEVIDPGAEQPVSVDRQRILEAVLHPPCRRVKPPRKRPDLRRLAALTVCPSTKGSLALDDGHLVSAGHRYPIDDGIPLLFDDAAPDPTASELEAKLRSLWPGDPARVRAVLGVRKRLEAPEPTAELSWTFDEERHREAFTPLHDVQADRGNGLAFTSLGQDPSLLGPAVIYPEQGFRGFELVLSAVAPADGAAEPRAQLYWLGPGDLDFDERRSLSFPVVVDGEAHAYHVAFETPAYRGAEPLAFLFRLDPLDRPGRFSLRSFRFLPR